MFDYVCVCLHAFVWKQVEWTASSPRFQDFPQPSEHLQRGGPRGEGAKSTKVIQIISNSQNREGIKVERPPISPYINRRSILITIECIFCLHCPHCPLYCILQDFCGTRTRLLLKLLHTNPQTGSILRQNLNTHQGNQLNILHREFSPGFKKYIQLLATKTSRSLHHHNTNHKV